MKKLTVLVAITLVLQSSGYLIKVPTSPTAQPQSLAPTGLVHLLKLVLPLFDNVCEDSTDPAICRLAQEFSLSSTNGDYLIPEVISNLQKLKTSKGLLAKGEIFTEYNPDHMKELKTVYEILYNARTFDTFFKAASWARQNLNCGLYVNAIYMALLNRRDTERLSIPAPYEVLPNYFIVKDIITQGSTLLAGGEMLSLENIRNEGNAYTIDANYTGRFYDNMDDSKLAYFREDVGLNSYYFLRKLQQTSCLDNINSGCGENLYQMMKQFMARYDLERYANGLPELEGIIWNDLSDVSYDPMLIYSNGNEFAHRTSSIDLSGNEDAALLQTIESNIATVVSHMRQTETNKTQILNHLMQLLVVGDRSYETLARRLLGKDLTNNGSPSVLEHYMTSLRDPMFWKINKKIVELVDNALKLFPTYSRNELYFPGVEVVNIEVKKMMTSFDYFEFDVTDALKIANASTAFQVKIGQPRLNHKPFTVKVNISSLVIQKGLIKMYVGPKMLPGELVGKKNLFVLLDMFEINLKMGTNIVSRTSDQMKQFSDDFISLKTLHKKVEDAEFGINSLPLKTIELQTGFPTRLILPKGLPQGLPLQLFVFVAPFMKRSISGAYSVANMELNIAILSPGYPLDLEIQDRQLFELPNAIIKDVFVTQKGDNKIENYGGSGVMKSWYGNDDLSTQTYGKRPFDYNSKRGQYGNQDDKTNFHEYSVIREDSNPVEFDQDTNEMIKIPASYDYASKKNEPFDYKSKKEQYGPKEDYAAKRKSDLYKYRIDATITPSTETTNFDEYHDVKEDTNLFEYHQEMNNRTENSLKLTAAYDYAAKRKEPFDYASKRKVPFDYASKRKEPFDYVSKRKEPFEYNSKRDQYGNQDNKTNFDENHVTKEDTNHFEFDQNIDEMLNNPVKLTASYDYASKKKEPFDYKSKKEQYGKKEDYVAKRKSDLYKYRTDATITPSTEKNDIEVTEREFDKEIFTVVINSKLEEQNTNKADEANDDLFTPVLIEDDMQRIQLPTSLPMKRYSVFDFIFRSLDDDDSDDGSDQKVYE